MPAGDGRGAANRPIKRWHIVFIGLASLVGLLYLATASTRAPSSNVIDVQALTRLKYALGALDDLQKRGVLPAGIAELERQRRVVEIQAILSESQIQALVELEQTLVVLGDLQQRGVLSKEVVEAQRQYYLARARSAVGESLELNHLAVLVEYLETSPEEMQATRQEEAGPYVLTNLTWIFLGLLFLAVAGWFFYLYLISTGKHVPIRARAESNRTSSISARRWRQPPWLPHRSQNSVRQTIASIEPDVFPPAAEERPAALLNEHSSVSGRDGGFLPDLSASRLGSVEPLTRRELEVIQLVAEGLSNQEIAQRLTITMGTVKVHVSNIYGKLGVRKRVQAVAKARVLEILPDA